MKKRNVKVIATVVAVIIATLSLCVAGVALVVKDSLFNTNTPTYITSNSTVIGSIEKKGDYEAFIFDITKPGALNVRLEHDNLLDTVKCGYTVTLYKIIGSKERTYQELTFFRSFWSDVTSSWGETGVSKGTYCVVVEPGADILYGDFTLVTSFTATTSFEQEPNDTKEKANELKIGSAKYGSSSLRQDGVDDDWYVFELAEDSCVNFSFAHDDLTLPAAGWTIKLLTEDGATVCDFASKLTDTIIKTGTLGLKAGKYYIMVEAQSEIADTYSILVGTDRAVNFEFELNDTPETATNLPCNIGISGSLADRLLSLDKDYYKFTLTKDGVINFTFSHPEIEGNKNGWNIKILKPEGNGKYYQIVKKVSAWNESELRISNLGLAAGDYYVLIDGDALFYNSANYTCRWTFEAKNNYEKEPNSVARRAEEIDFNKVYYGAMISSDVNFDEDYYKFTLTKKTNVCLELGHEKIYDSSVSWVANILDEDNDVLYSVESGLNDGLVSTGVVTLPEGTYYVKIETGMYGSEMPYYFRLVR